MPELPEVETVRRTLKNFVLDREITAITVHWPRIVEDDPDLFKQALLHQHIRDIDRVGKYLIFVLDDTAFVSHLRMEGKYNIVPSKSPLTRHDHVIFRLDDGRDLRYNDTRKFGRMVLVDHDNYRHEQPLTKLGPEPFEATLDEVYPAFKKSKRYVKSILLDQSVMCGLGNIYANEVMFVMGMHPKTRGKDVSKKRVQGLIDASKAILSEAITQGGTTIHSFDANGIHGLFQVKLHVHGQKTCKACGSEIKKIVVDGRSSYYCPVCQKRRY